MSFPSYLMGFLFLLSATFLGATTPSMDSLDFPTSWEGDWRGDLVIYNVKGLAQKIPMQLKIHQENDSLYRWTIIYGEDEVKGTRDYLLKIVDQTIGHYQVDEQNTIYLDSYLLGEKLISTFEVGGTYLISSTIMIDGELHYEIIAGPTSKTTKSGNTGSGEEKIPEVTSFLVSARQVAVLRKS